MASSSATPSTSTTPPVVDYKSERDVVDAYTRLRQELSGLADRVQDLEAQLSEHALVAKTMRPMDKGRKAFRLVRLFFDGDFFLIDDGFDSFHHRLENSFRLLFSFPHHYLPLLFQVGDVLVERTVGEVLPAVEQNLAQIEEVRREESCFYLFLFSLVSSSSPLFFLSFSTSSSTSL